MKWIEVVEDGVLVAAVSGDYEIVRVGEEEYTLSLPDGRAVACTTYARARWDAAVEDMTRPS